MITKRGPRGELTDKEGNLYYPKITREKINLRKSRIKTVMKETEEFLEKNNFSTKRKKELLKLEKDIIDLNSLKKIKVKKEFVKDLKNQKEKIKDYENKNFK